MLPEAEAAERQMASMRPRLISRGNWQVRGYRGLERLRFNEAPADQPGKCGNPSRIIKAINSFNEAPADQPGKSRFRSKKHRTITASMRPRLISRGNLWRRIRRMSMGGFNEAPADQPGK